MLRNCRTNTVLFALCSLLLLGGYGCKEKNAHTVSGDFAIERSFERGPLTVVVRVDPNTLSIAELLTLQFEATVSTGYDVNMPPIDQVLQHFAIVDWDNPSDRLGNENQVTKTRQYRLEPLLSGDYELPALTFVFYDVNDRVNSFQLETDPIAVTVTSLLGEDRENLTIADIEDVVDMPRSPLPWWVWTLLGALPIGGIAVFIWLKRRQCQQTVLLRVYKPAHEIAYARLQVLIAKKLVQAGEIKAFYEAISHILRHYIEDRFNLHAPEQTTEEFLLSLRDSQSLTTVDKERLREFLQHCDLVKFAKHQPQQEEIQSTFDLVKIFIEKTRSDQHQVDVTDKVTPTVEREVPA